jgi:hypothetical protein
LNILLPVETVQFHEPRCLGFVSAERHCRHFPKCASIRSAQQSIRTTTVNQIFAELKRRGVVKVATAYLVVSWLVLEIGHTLFLIFELPHLGLQTVFVLLAIGFPVATAAAWRYQFGTAKQDHEAAHTDGHGSQRPSSSASSRCWSSAPS